MSQDRLIEMTPDKIQRMLQIITWTTVFNDLDRQRVLVARILARSMTDDEVFEMVQKAATEPIPDQTDPEYVEAVQNVDKFVHSLFDVEG